MAKIFLDANYFIDVIEDRGNVDKASLEDHILYISPLSIHILAYVYKYQMPAQSLSKLLRVFNQVNLTDSITNKSLVGPTNDFEDNVQLHCAAIAECDLFLTLDKNLLGMKFFGKTQIVPKPTDG